MMTNFDHTGHDECATSGFVVVTPLIDRQRWTATKIRRINELPALRSRSSIPVTSLQRHLSGGLCHDPWHSSFKTRWSVKFVLGRPRLPHTASARFDASAVSLDRQFDCCLAHHLQTLDPEYVGSNPNSCSNRSDSIAIH
jgi:hypothetical protein